MISTLITILVISVTLSLIAAVTYVRRYKASIAHQSKGLVLLKEFRVLLTLSQQHRGLTNGFLNGDTPLLNQIKPIQTQIERSMKNLEHEQWIANNAEWLDISRRWQQILKEHQVMEPEMSLARHTALIRCLLFLVDDCAEYYRLYEIKHGEQGSIRYLWQDLLVTAENIGQARAIGTGVAAAKACKSVDRIRLNYLKLAISKTEHLGSDDTLARLKSTIEREVLGPTPSISPREYFSLATLAIETLLSTFDKTLEEAQTNLLG